jgi:hypothetical protein
MKLEKSNLNDLIITFTKQELVILSSAIHETLREIEEWEFFTRTGTKTGEAISLLERIKVIIQHSDEKDEFKLKMSGNELLVLNSSLGEAIAGFHLENFEQHIGVSKQVASLLFEQIHQVYGH